MLWAKPKPEEINNPNGFCSVLEPFTNGRRAQRLLFTFWASKNDLSSLLFISLTAAVICCGDLCCRCLCHIAVTLTADWGLEEKKTENRSPWLRFALSLTTQAHCLPADVAHGYCRKVIWLFALLMEFLHAANKLTVLVVSTADENLSIRGTFYIYLSLVR